MISFPSIRALKVNMKHRPHHPSRAHSDTHPHPHTHHPTRRDFLSTLSAAAVLGPWVFQQEQTAADTAERFRQMSEDFERKGLAEPFKGISTHGEVLPGIFEIAPSGVSTEPVRNAAEKFIASLNNVQLARTMFPVDDVKWRKWMNQHFYVR